MDDIADLLLEVEDGRSAKDRGMQIAASKCPDAVDAAYDALVRLACTQQFVHIDDFLPVIESLPLKPSPNAMGSVWQRARKNDVLTKTGRYKACAAHARKHAHEYPIYRSLIFAGGGSLI